MSLNESEIKLLHTAVRKDKRADSDLCCVQFVQSLLIYDRADFIERNKLSQLYGQQCGKQTRQMNDFFFVEYVLLKSATFDYIQKIKFNSIQIFLSSQ